jgi:hypothetical protein
MDSKIIIHPTPRRRSNMKSRVNVKYGTVIGAIFLTLALLMGCAGTGSKPFWGNPETGLILQYRLSSGQTLAYQSTTTESQTMEMMGSNQETATEIVSKYSVKGKKMDKDKNIMAEVTVQSMIFDIQSPQGEMDIDTEPIIGKPFGITFSVLGEELGYTDIDSTMEISMGQGGTRNLKDLFRNPLQDLPDYPVKIGDSWTNKDSLTTPQGGLEITVVNNSTLTFIGFEDVDGIDCAKIKLESTGTIDGVGQQMGMDVALEGDIEGNGTFYFAYKKGVYVKYTGESFTEMTAALSGQMNMTIPISQESNSEVKLVDSSMDLK